MTNWESEAICVAGNKAAYDAGLIIELKSWTLRSHKKAQANVLEWSPRANLPCQ